MLVMFGFWVKFVGDVDKWGLVLFYLFMLDILMVMDVKWFIKWMYDKVEDWRKLGLFGR